jgi:hypothetical protein
MRNLLALAAAALIAFVVVGWFLGWYSNFHVDVNTPKITEDINKAKAKIENILTKKPNTTTPAPTPAPAPTPPGTPPRVTIVPVTTPNDGTFVLPGSPDIHTPPPAEVLPPLTTPPPSSSVPPPLPPR